MDPLYFVKAQLNVSCNGSAIPKPHGTAVDSTNRENPLSCRSLEQRQAILHYRVTSPHIVTIQNDIINNYYGRSNIRQNLGWGEAGKVFSQSSVKTLLVSTLIEAYCLNLATEYCHVDVFAHYNHKCDIIECLNLCRQATSLVLHWMVQAQLYSELATNCQSKRILFFGFTFWILLLSSNIQSSLMRRLQARTTQPGLTSSAVVESLHWLLWEAPKALFVCSLLL